MNNKKIHTAEHFFLKAQYYEKKNEWQSAILCYESALKLQPNHLEACHNLAIALRNHGKMERALTASLKAANLAPDNPIIQFSVGVSLERLGKYERAAEVYKNIIKQRSNYIPALNNLGRLLDLKGNTIEAIKLLKKALKKDAKSTDVIINLANCYLSIGKPKKTINLLLPLVKGNKERKIAHQEIALNSIGVASHILHDYRKAVIYFRKAIKTVPNFAEAHENLAQTLLFLGQYNNAWIEYEWRWLNLNNNQSKPRFLGLPWNGEHLGNETLLVYAEQGFGDVIQFSRFLSMIDIQKENLILACQPTLIDLLTTLTSISRVKNINGKLPSYNKYAPLLSLPRILKISMDNIPSAPYLSAFPKNILGDMTGLKIGINWAGMPRHQSDPYRNRSCPVEAFEPLISLHGVNFFSLQTGQHSTELGKINKTSSVKDLSAFIKSFKDTAALVNELDVVITVDTALAHLAGAMGKAVWVLLAKHSDWRWNTRYKKNIWYPTARIFKQSTPGDWSDPLNNIVKELKKLIP